MISSCFSKADRWDFHILSCTYPAIPMCNLSCHLDLGCVKFGNIVTVTVKDILKGTKVCPWRQRHLRKRTSQWNPHFLSRSHLESWAQNGPDPELLHPVAPEQFILWQGFHFTLFLLISGVCRKWDRSSEACYRQVLEGSRFLNAKSISGTLLGNYPEEWFQGTGTAIGK